MKNFITKTYVFLMPILLLVSFQISGQNTLDTSCGTITTEQSLEYFKHIKSQIKVHEQNFMTLATAKSSSKREVINSIPVKAHIIRTSNGTGGFNNSDLDAAIAHMNSIYADAYMEFFLCDGINYIHDDAYYSFNKSTEGDLTETHNVNGLINIYFTNHITNNSDTSICGYTNNEARNDFIVIKNDCAKNNSTLAHEMGHFFSLMHTHGPDDIELTTERVDGSNCDTDGDGICDTPADPLLTHTTVNNFCQYTGDKTDANGDTYAPDTNNIMSYSRKGCRNQFTPQQLARIYAFYQTAKSYLACPSFNANFSADISQTCEESLTVNFTNNCSDITQWQWDIDSDGIIDYNIQNPAHTYSTGNYDVTLTASNKSKTITKTFSNFIKVGVQTDFLNEEFENIAMIGESGWTANDLSGNGYNWLLKKGETNSENTGPLLKNPENKVNTYIYAEATGVKPNDVTELISPCIYVAHQNSAIEFAYHMFGNGVGELHVDIKTDYGYIYNDVIEPLYGSQQNNQSDGFFTQDIDLSSYANQTISIRFRAVRGVNWDGDIALDNIFVKIISVPISDDPVKVYPNPIKGDVVYVKTNSFQELSTTYNISNLEGQIFASGTLSGTNQPINISLLSSGMYLLTIKNKETSITKKIIK
ncbi:T9SS-dependent choice-of-anchor J family protein [Changchengzhania lutea]|uniref:T9SS-dependent choice-of-anchor J family protein n=1 Tax=Changchengzhania lutea TaxID=2049305 RepID=UPI00163D49EA|nr:T9SS type A sorting domain-containing protein [Changchengzhania lutea]